MFQADPYKIRPKTDWAIVLQDERVGVLPSGIIIPMELTAEKLHEGSGTVIRLGLGKKSLRLGISCNDRVMYRTYLRHVVPIDSDLKWPSGAKQEYFFINLDDLTAVLELGVEVGALSRKKS
jgi:co-chaperonin GroES (HSP10)